VGSHADHDGGADPGERVGGDRSIDTDTDTVTKTDTKGTDVTPSSPSATHEQLPAPPEVPPEPPEVLPEVPPEVPPETRPGADRVPVTRIRASGGWRAINLRELWRYRELLFFLALRDVKLRYKQTAFGLGWAVLQPLLTMAVFAVFFGKLGGLP